MSREELTVAPGRPRLAGLLLLASTLAGLLVLEAGFRLRAWALDREILEEALEAPAEIPPDRRVKLRQLIRASRNDDIIYELRPRLSVLFMGQPVTTSDAGFRGRRHPREKPPGTMRVLGLGDSVMFGWGVGDGEDYLSLLEARLIERHPEVRWEVINTAVPGYNTVMEVATLREKGLAYAPDLVVLGFCGNDMNLPNFIREKEDYLTLRKSFLAEFVGEGLARLPRREALVARPEWAHRRVFEEEPGRAPRGYAHMVGFGGFTRAMEELARLRDQQGFLAVVFCYPDAPDEVRRLASRLSLPVVNAAPWVEAFLKQRGIEGYGDSPLVLSPADPHPSRLGHALIAEGLLRALDEGHLLERVRASAATR